MGIDHITNSKYNRGVSSDIIQIEPELIFDICVQKADSDDDKLNEDKLEILQEMGLFIDLFEIEKEGNIPTDLLLCIKVMFMEEDEFNIYKTEMMTSGYLNDFNSDN